MDSIEELRRRADKSRKSKSIEIPDVATLSREQIQGLFHELQTQQFELEMQNEETEAVPRGAGKISEPIRRSIRVCPCGLSHPGPKGRHS